MKRVNIAKLKNELSAYLEYVRRGGIVQVLDRDEPVAEILPFARRDRGEDCEFITRLLRHGFVRPAKQELDKDFLSEKLPGDKSGTGVLSLLLNERSGGR